LDDAHISKSRYGHPRVLRCGEGDEFFFAGRGFSFGGFAGDGGVGAGGDLQVAGAGADGFVRVVDGVGVLLGVLIGEEDIVETHGGAVVVVVAVEEDLASAGELAPEMCCAEMSGLQLRPEGLTMAHAPGVVA
jgi:hypothetical protein